MAQFKLEISGDLSELATIAAALGGQGVRWGADLAPETAALLSNDVEPARATRGRGRKADTGLTVFEAPKANPETYAADLAKDLARGEIAPLVVTGPSEGAVTYETLKDLMTELLKKKSASVAQQVIREATGQSSLSACTPEQYPAAHAALTAALA